MQLNEQSKTDKEFILPLDNKDWRCPHCGVLLFKGNIPSGGTIELKCWHRRCEKFVRFMSI